MVLKPSISVFGSAKRNQPENPGMLELQIQCSSEVLMFLQMNTESIMEAKSRICIL